MNLFEIEKEFLPKKVGGMGYSEIREELIKRGVDQEGIGIVIRSIDNKILSGEFGKISKRRGKEAFWMGFVLLLGGIIISLGTFLGWIKMGHSFIFAFAPMIGGVSMMSYGKFGSGKFK